MKLAEQLNTKQREAYGKALAGESFFLTGPAGTGKSFVISAIREAMPLDVTALTGIAASNLGGSTLHSWAGVGLGDKPVAVCVSRMGHETKSRLKAAKALVIDEISMASPELLDLVSDVLASVRESDEVFGGMQVILCGDFLQLAPVSRKRNPPMAFESDAWDELDPETIELTDIVRQEDAVFCDLLNGVRTGQPRDWQPFFDRVLPAPESNVTKLRTHNKQVDRENAAELAKLPGEQVSYHARDLGHETLVKDSRLPAILDLKPGALVMMLANSGDLYNGQLGRVVGFRRPGENATILEGTPEAGYPVVEFDGKEYPINPITREVTRGTKEIEVTPLQHYWVDANGERYSADQVKIRDGQGYATVPRVVASREQLPLRLGWAISVHKSQGMTLDRVEVDLRRAFAPGQVYTALSRVRSLEGLYIKGIGDVEISDKALSFYGYPA